MSLSVSRPPSIFLWKLGLKVAQNVYPVSIMFMAPTIVHGQVLDSHKNLAETLIELGF